MKLSYQGFSGERKIVPATVSTDNSSGQPMVVIGGGVILDAGAWHSMAYQIDEASENERTLIQKWKSSGMI